jgi:hypothetical protein
LVKPIKATMSSSFNYRILWNREGHWRVLHHKGFVVYGTSRTGVEFYFSASYFRCQKFRIEAAVAKSSQAQAD